MCHKPLYPCHQSCKFCINAYGLSTVNVRRDTHSRTSYPSYHYCSRGEKPSLTKLMRQSPTAPPALVSETTRGRDVKCSNQEAGVRFPSLHSPQPRPPPPIAKLTLPSVYPLEAGLNTNWDDESLTEEKRKLHYNAKSLSLIALLHIRGVT